MSVTDTILFVKEIRTCEYTMVIHTPRLCGEPGFRSRFDDVESAAIRCREVLPPAETSPVKSIPATADQPNDPLHPDRLSRTESSPHPGQYKPRSAIRVPIPSSDKDSVPQAEGQQPSLLRRALEALLAKSESTAATDGSKGTIEDIAVYEMREVELENGEIVYEFELDIDALDVHKNADDQARDSAHEKADDLARILRAAGIPVQEAEVHNLLDVKFKRGSKPKAKEGDEDGKPEKKAGDGKAVRDEL